MRPRGYRPAPGIAAWALLAALITAGGTAWGGTGQGAQDGRLSIDALLSIAHPAAPAWSPSGGRIAFLREHDGAIDLWWTSEELSEPVAVTHEVDRNEPAAVTGFAWTATGDGLVFSLRGDLFLYRLDSAETDTLVATAAAETAPVLSADGTRIAFLRDGQPWAGGYPTLEGDALIDGPGAFRSLSWSPDGRYLAATYGQDETVVEDTRGLMGGKLEFSRRESVSSGLAVIDTEQGDVYWVESGPAYSSQPAFSPAGALAWQEVSADAKRRDIVVAAAPDWAPRVLVSETDDAWWTLTYMEAGPRWSPTAERFVFVSERDGWAHAYLLDTSLPGAEPLQLTSGEFEVEEPAWSPDGDKLVLSANRGSSSERGLQILDLADLDAGPPAMEPISRLRGTSTQARWRPDGGAIAFLHADPDNPLDLWVQEPGPGAAQQLSDAWPEGVDESELVRPQRARFSSADGKLIPAQLFLPPQHEDIAGPIPAVVWVHGGGIRQNRYGWHPLRAYAVFYGFHQYLLQQGYAVVTVDYRGSIGYGREFRQGHHLDLGGRDLDDVLGAIRYLRRIEEVEIGKIGVWGISYGGFLALQALVQAPTAFDAGVDVAGVVDWADWAVDPGGLWIDGRMGDTTDNADQYRASSPIHQVERLERPLLILHGTDDRAVPVLQSFRLTDELVRAGKPFDVAIYPGEAHAFVRSRTWRDAFRRVEEFFDAHLR